MELEQKISFFRHHDREFVSKNEIVESTSDLVPFYRLIRIFSLRAGQGSERFARRGRRQSVGPRRGSPHVLRRPRRITLTANVNTGGLNLNGGGQFNLASPSTYTYTGATNINSGGLEVNGSLAAGSTVNVHGTLSRSGTVAGTANVFSFVVSRSSQFECIPSPVAPM